ncbi:AurF N-oxygenase family protein [Sciscionella marina]|uniref:AurF N-oxygenase family protein n=1 Tax=Sciscionella marina TaxID=508770 RepID=UPI000372CE59|nr:diiron oxygenase [Sciscionella marina]
MSTVDRARQPSKARQPRKPKEPKPREQVAERLLKSSAGLWYDPELDLDWAAPLDEDKFFIPPELITLYGTPLWDSLSRTQRIELSRQELANTLSVGIWFENVLMELLVRLNYRKDPTSKHVQYAYTELADECRHSTMFGKVIDRIGARPYSPGLVWFNLGKVFPFLLRGSPMWVAALMGEEVFDVLQRDILRDGTEELQPLVHGVMRIHVTEEARHMRFAREALVRRQRKAGFVEKQFAKFIGGAAAVVLGTLLNNKEMYARAGLDAEQAHRQAKRNPHAHAQFRHGAARIVSFFSEEGVDVMGFPYTLLWRYAKLL